jgi:hypothetical protein
MNARFAGLILVALAGLGTASAQVNVNQLGQNQVESGNLIATGSYTAYENTPFFPTDWRTGTVKTTNGKQYAVDQMRYNAYEDRPEYELNGKIYAFVQPVAEFTLKEGAGVVFRNGFRPVDQQRERSFYEILHDGKIKLLRYRKANLLDVTQYNSATKQKRFDFSETYYLARPEAAPVRLKRDKKSVLDALNDKTAELETFISQDKLKFRDWDDVRKLLSHYDTL